MINAPIQSGNSDTWSGIGQGIGNTDINQYLYCDIQGNRGYMFNPYKGVLFANNGSTIVITKVAEYVYDPTKWAFIDPLSKNVAAILISLDAISNKHEEFNNPHAQITLVENVHTFLTENVIAEWSMKVTDIHNIDTKLNIDELVKNLSIKLSSTLYKQIPTEQDYVD